MPIDMEFYARFDCVEFSNVCSELPQMIYVVCGLYVLPYADAGESIAWGYNRATLLLDVYQYGSLALLVGGVWNLRQ
jgi:hypothetical protein